MKLSYTSGPDEPALIEATLAELLRDAAATAPDRLAMVFGSPNPSLRRQWTYAQMYRDAQRTARALASRFEPGERVAIWSQNSPEWILVEFGAAMAGVILDRATQIVVETFEPGLVLELMETYRVSAMGGVPTMLIA